MFDDEELSQLREDEDEWKGHVDRQTVKKSRTSRKAFLSSITASFALVGLMFVLVFSGIMAQALIGLGGIGGFYAEIDRLDGSDLAIYPALGPTAACNSDSGIDFNDGHPGTGPDSFTSLPQLRAEIGGATVPQGEELRVIKDVDLPDIVPLNTFRVEIAQGDTSGNVSINDIAFYVTGLEAEEITFQNAQIREFFSPNAQDSFFNGTGTTQTTTPVTNGSIDASPGEFAIQNRPGTNASAKIVNATARAHFLAFDSLTIEFLELETQYGNSSDPLTNPDPIKVNQTGGANCPAY